MNSFSVQQIPYYLDQGRELMITGNAPTITISKLTFGNASIRAIIKSHLFTMANAMGITSTPDAIDAITDDIISGYGDLKVTELILAFKMIREGKFREGSGGERNRGEFFGNLSSGVICDCLNRFRFDYRNPIIARQEQEADKRRKEEEMANAAKYDDYKQIIFTRLLTCPPDKMGALFRWFQPYIKNQQDMIEIKEYIKERADLHKKNQDLEEINRVMIDELYALRLLKTRLDEYLSSKPADDDTLATLRKGVAYIDGKFPSKQS